VPKAPSSTAALPTGPGVYRFRDGRGRTLYIGRATSLRSRVRSYWGDLRGRGHLRRMVPKVAQVEALACRSLHEACWLERNLLEQSLPYWNRARGGAEVPVYVVLDARGLAPSLRVVHDRAEVDAQVACFGPYLGGFRVRTAIDALARVLPLASTGTRLGGFERDLARLRGVGPHDRARIVGVLTGLFERDPDAVRQAQALLTARRDRAVAELAFERAASVQAQVRALEWLAAEQQVTCDGAGDYQVCGWAGGRLLLLQARGGRMNRWSVRPCSAEAAARPLAKTPRAWRDFAAVNAELAAALDG